MAGKAFLHAHIDGMLAKMSASAYWKDKDGYYLGANDKFIEVAELHSHHELSNATDLDLHWSAHAKKMMRNDRTIFQNEYTHSFIESSNTTDTKVVHFLSYKSPLRSNKGKVIGVFGLSYRIESESWTMDKFNEIATLLGIDAADNVKKFILKKKQFIYGLTKRQTDCLYYLEKNMTMRQIALQLELSPRTIEHYIEAIKIKLNCDSKAEMLAKIFGLSVETKENLDKSTQSPTHHELLNCSENKQYDNSGMYINRIYITPREVDILKEIARGRTAKQIANIYSISPRTVECHLSNIKEKFGVNCKANLIDIIIDKL